MSARAAPLLSVVVATDGEEAVAELLGHLARQTVADRLEAVVVAPAGALAGAPERTAPELRVVAVPSIHPLSEARARGVRAARAPLVVVGETHALPEPEWAAALIAACESGATGAVPLIESGNGGLISWSNFVLTYAHWSGPPARDLERAPEQNTVLARADLLSFGDGLAERLEAGGGLAEELRRRGARLALVPAARVRHLNVSSPRWWLPERFAGGRVYGAARSRHWSLARKLLHAAGAPLGTLLFLSRAVRTAAAARCWPERRRLLAVPALALGVAAWVAGESAAYLAGPGRAPAAVADYEINRRRFLAGSAARPAAPDGGAHPRTRRPSRAVRGGRRGP